MLTQSPLHIARVDLMEALGDEWEELAQKDRELVKLTDEIMFAKRFILVAQERIRSIPSV
jgi:hypothetical protein